MVKPFKKVSETVVWQGEFRKMKRKSFELPNGKINDYEVLALDPSLVGAVAVLVINEKNEVLVNKEFRTGSETVMFDLPSGGIEVGEAPEVAASRELMEETGYRVAPKDLQFLGAVAVDPYSEVKWHYFLTRKVEKSGAQQLDENEFIEVTWVPMAELVEAARAGKMFSGYAMPFFMAWNEL
jgi:ADP-ribose pyrophosphatase